MNEEIANQIYNKKEFLAKGKRGFVYLSEYKKKKYIVKEKNPDSTAEGTIENESLFNAKLNKLGIGPKFYFSNNKFLIREFIDGVTIYDWMNDKSKSVIKKVLTNVMNQCRKMDLAGINKFEMTNPHKDIIIDKKDEPYIIDFERCRVTEKPKNVTQFCQFLSTGKMKFELEKKGVSFGRKLIFAAMDYKKTNNEQEFKKIRNILRAC